MSEDEKPWWNDGDAVGGAFATIIMLTAVIVACLLVVALAIRIANWIISG